MIMFFLDIGLNHGSCSVSQVLGIFKRGGLVEIPKDTRTGIGLTKTLGFLKCSALYDEISFIKLYSISIKCTIFNEISRVT